MARVNTGSGWTSDNPAAAHPGLVYENLWAWTTKTTDANVAGQVGINIYQPPSSWPLASHVHLNDKASDGTDATNAFTRLKVGDVIYLQMETDATRYGRYGLTALPTDQGGWWMFPVAPDPAGSNGRVPTDATPTVVRLIGSL